MNNRYGINIVTSASKQNSPETIQKYIFILYKYIFIIFIFFNTIYIYMYILFYFLLINK